MKTNVKKKILNSYLPSSNSVEISQETDSWKGLTFAFYTHLINGGGSHPQPPPPSCSSRWRVPPLLLLIPFKTTTVAVVAWVGTLGIERFLERNRKNVKIRCAGQRVVSARNSAGFLLFQWTGSSRKIIQNFHLTTFPTRTVSNCVSKPDYLNKQNELRGR